jgi:pilus assembly protein Flp/PilA
MEAPLALALSTRIAWRAAELRDGLRRRQGQGMVEYALIIALIAIVLVAALTAFGGGLQKLYTSIGNTVNGS